MSIVSSFVLKIQCISNELLMRERNSLRQWNGSFILLLPFEYKYILKNDVTGCKINFKLICAKYRKLQNENFGDHKWFLKTQFFMMIAVVVPQD